MITFAEFKSGVASRIDAGGLSDYYNDDANYIPAFNMAVNWISSVISRALETNKITAEALSELRRARVYQTSALSRIKLEDFWFIESVNPLPAVLPYVTINLGETESIYRDDLIHQYSNYWCKRLTKEEWEMNARNPFSPGNTIQNCGTLTHGSSLNVSFAYLSPILYNPQSETSVEIEVRPYIRQKLCTVFVVERPVPIEDQDGEVRFHPKLLPMLVEKGLFYMSYEQGDGPSIMEMSEKEVMTVAQILTL